jgi:hemolysin activation/secretion protein
MRNYFHLGIWCSVLLFSSLPLTPCWAKESDAYPFRALLVVDDASKIASTEAAIALESPVAVRDVPVLVSPEFARLISVYVGKPINTDLVNTITAIITKYASDHGHAGTTVEFPSPQDVTKGILRAIVRQQSSPTYLLSRLILADSPEHAMEPESARDNKVVVRNISFISSQDIGRQLAPFFGRPIDNDLLRNLVTHITQYARDHDRLVTNVRIPSPQDIREGTLRFVVVVGHYNELTLRGNRWFSRKLIEEKLGIKPGDEVRLSTLEQGVNWANANPFRQIKVAVNDLQNTAGTADLYIAVQEARPIRFALSYDDAGNAIIGRSRYTGMVMLGNLWGRDHQAFYQYLQTKNYDYFHAHGINYKIPLSWRHFIEFSGSYAEANPTFGGGHLSQIGRTTVGGVRYTIPLEAGANAAEIYGGIDFKQTNNNLEFGGTSVLKSKTDVFQFVLGLSKTRRDAHGTWVMGASLKASPGNIDSRNSTQMFQEARVASNARYACATTSIQRLQDLDHGWELMSRLSAQAATTNLLSSEQFSIGGSNTVRGFDEVVFSGDNGFVISNDLMLPTWKFDVSRLSKKAGSIDTRFLIFYDAGQVFLHRRFAFDPTFTPLASTGVGFRATYSNYFSLNFDYGWHITRLPYPAPQNERGHIKMVIAF